MAGDARVSTALAGHWKIRKLKKRLGAAGCWSLIGLWLWTADNRPDGELVGMTIEDIELVADWEGEPGALVEALRDLRLLDAVDDHHAVHGWAEHQPWVSNRDQRIAAAKRAANARWHRSDDLTRASEADAQSMPAACVTDTQRMPDASGSGAPNPNPTQTQTQRLEVNTKTKVRRTFTPPAIEEVVAYCHERGNSVDAQQWFNHYMANGWKVGRNPMVDWKASVRTWEKDRKGKPNGNHKAQQRTESNLRAVEQAFPLALDRRAAGDSR